MIRTMRKPFPRTSALLRTALWLGGLLLLAAAGVSARTAGLSPLPAEARPVQLGPLQPEAPEREEALLCYHTGAAYYIKLPHSVYGDPGIVFQRITPGASGHLNGFQLRLFNDYPGHTRHFGTLQLSVHRRVGGLPGPWEMMRMVQADTVDNAVLDVPLESQFQFASGEEFYLGLAFEPASSQDTVAYVAAALGDYTGHSFFFLDGQIVWWGDPDGTPFGDMHYCADVWLDDEQAFLQFPWSQLDLGRGRAGGLLRQSLPLLNQGTAPLVIHEAAVTAPDWSSALAGPDSLMPPDTLFLELAWQAPALESASATELSLLSNAANGPERHIPLRAASSTADLLLADWDEWPTAAHQFQDSTASGGWMDFTGLYRPGPFMGHGAAPSGLQVWNVLALRNLRLEEGALLRLRWCQYQRSLAGLGQHALCWRDPRTGLWQALDEPDLGQPPWIGPESEWYTVPWAEWRVPCSGIHELGFLYAGLGPGDIWFVDDVELCVLDALPPPLVSIQAHGGGARLSWAPVLGATRYRVERVDCTPPRVLCWTADTTWTHAKAQRLGRALYRVTAWRGVQGEEAPPLALPADDEGGEESR